MRSERRDLTFGGFSSDFDGDGLRLNGREWPSEPFRCGSRSRTRGRNRAHSRKNNL